MSGVATWQMAVRDALADGGCRTIAELAEMAGIDRKKVSTTMCRLILRGLAERVERGCFRLTERGMQSARDGEVIRSGPQKRHSGLTRPRRNSFRQRAWAAMRMSGKFTVPEILRLAARPGTRGGSADNLHRYLRALEQAGYVRRLPVRQRGTAPGSNGFIRWMLVRDSGPQAPTVRRDGSVLDRNTGEIIGEEGDHEQAA